MNAKLQGLGLIGFCLSLGIGAVFGAVALSSRAADHQDAPLITLDPRRDITDVYVFVPEQNPAQTVLMMNVNPDAGVLSPTTFDPATRYQFLIDSNDDDLEDYIYQFNFGLPNAQGEQIYSVIRISHPFVTNTVQSLGTGVTGQIRSLPGGGFAAVDVFDDPFFFDQDAFIGSLGRTFCDGQEFDYYAGQNVTGIVMQIPRASYGDPDIARIWTRTLVAATQQQVDRMGFPGINMTFIPNSPYRPAGSEPSQEDAYNAGHPVDDRADFRDVVLESLELFHPPGSPVPEIIADSILPDFIYLQKNPTPGVVNGRPLDFDAMNYVLSILTNFDVQTDCVDANDVNLQTGFPYLAPPHTSQPPPPPPTTTFTITLSLPITIK